MDLLSNDDAGTFEDLDQPTLKPEPSAPSVPPPASSGAAIDPFFESDSSYLVVSNKDKGEPTVEPVGGADNDTRKQDGDDLLSKADLYNAPEEKSSSASGGSDGNCCEYHLHGF